MGTIHSKNVLYDLYTKLVGAGFSFFVFITFFAMTYDVNAFALSEILASPWLWVAFYGYAILCSFVIDGIGKRWPMRNGWTIVLYCIAGTVIFFFLVGFWATVFVAGPIGIGMALCFYFGMRVVRRSKWISFIFALIVPIVFLVVSMTDFTKKRDWEAEQTETNFEAEFSYFNGEHKIPIQLHEEDVLTFKVDFRTDGGNGFHFENKKGAKQPMNEKGDWLVFEAEASGEYFIVIRGDRSNGSVSVDWDIE